MDAEMETSSEWREGFILTQRHFSVNNVMQ
jgi:hypothetical protein